MKIYESRDSDVRERTVDENMEVFRFCILNNNIQVFNFIARDRTKAFFYRCHLFNRLVIVTD